ncbi:MAG: polysaccharide deacetylase family protein [Tannerella sp.]|nr:polysaccharide deacetylase family protein [Tannerella sp.]
MTEITRYILRFMTGEHLPDDVSRFVGYTSDSSSFPDYKVVIIPSGFFEEGSYGTAKTKPSIPPGHIEGVPFLYGTPDVERVGDTVVVHADLVASTYFLLSRYEEVLHRDIRDEHGRFPGRESLPRRAGFIDRPVVDEYGRLIRGWLGSTGVPRQELVPFIRKVNLTHDIDVPFTGRTWRSVAGKILSGRHPVAAVREKYAPLEENPYYTFPWMLEQNRKLQCATGEERCRMLFFFRAGGKTRQDRPRYDPGGKDIRSLFSLCRRYGAEVGLHSSYQAGKEPSLILSEKRRLEEAFEMEITQNRHHFLTAREPEDMEYLEAAGITDDYTMGYADVAGFRLGTALPVRYINPVTRRLSALRLHPLTVMDSTLNEVKYMNLTRDRAEEYCMRLISSTRNVNGELTLLWHNTSAIERSGYLRRLYAVLTGKLGE